MTRVSFAHAFERWYKLAVAERARIDDEKKRGGTILSWEALDHICGLAVEAGLKALMIKAKLVTADDNGDFPAERATNRRPHIDALWDLFAAKANNRVAGEWLSRLGGGKGAPPNLFRDWRAEHRYARDGTVSEAVASARVGIAKRLHLIAQEEGLS
jgi:hypothetical protein